MKLKEGNSVEVLRKENDLFQSWFLGKIVAVDGDDFIVRYKSLTNRKGEMAVERVYKKDIRPRPPHKKKMNGWIAGDMVEVFDTKCWKVGKVAKVPKNNLFVIRVLGDTQLKEFNESNLRIRQAWHQNKWSVIDRVQKKPHNEIASRVRWNRSKTRLESSCEEAFSEVKRISCKRRKLNTNVVACERPLLGNHWLFMQVDRTSMNKYTDIDREMEKETSYEMPISLESTQFTEDSYQCSVASCSLKDFSQEHGGDICDSSDAESSFPSLSGKKLSFPSPAPQTLDVDIHKLELEAYRSTMQALYASGPLSWEQESLLTNLRLSLHITDEEHLLHLRHLLSPQVL